METNKNPIPMAERALIFMIAAILVFAVLRLLRVEVNAMWLVGALSAGAAVFLYAAVAVQGK